MWLQAEDALPHSTCQYQMHRGLTLVMLWLRVAAVEKAEAEKVQVVKAAEADAEVCTDSSLHALHPQDLKMASQR